MPTHAHRARAHVTPSVHYICAKGQFNSAFGPPLLSVCDPTLFNYTQKISTQICLVHVRK